MSDNQSIETIRDFMHENVTPADILAYVDRLKAELPDFNVWLDSETFEVKAQATRVRAIVMPDQAGVPNPFDDDGWETLGTFIRTGDFGPWTGALTPFCNSKFSDDPDIRDLGNFRHIFKADGIELAERYGAIVASVPGGIVIAGHDEIVRAYGYDNQHSRELARECIEAEARAYEQWCNGEVYGVVIVRDDDLGTDVVDWHDDYDVDPEDVVDSCWGFFGMDWATEAAHEMLAPWLTE